MPRRYTKCVSPFNDVAMNKIITVKAKIIDLNDVLERNEKWR